MDTGSLIRGAWELVPILFLLLVGGVIAVRSGVHRLASRQGVRLGMANASQVMLRILGYVAALLAVHEWIGIRPGLGW
jgi:hypothetical protein